MYLVLEKVSVIPTLHVKVVCLLSQAQLPSESDIVTFYVLIHLLILFWIFIVHFLIFYDDSCRRMRSHTLSQSECLLIFFEEIRHDDEEFEKVESC
jgi:hypothetical protein